MISCPACGNADKVYDQGVDPIYGGFVLCSLHGIQVVKSEQKTSVKKE